MPGVKGTMEEFKKGTLKSSSGQKVTNRKQAIAIGLSEDRQAGKAVPTKNNPHSMPESMGETIHQGSPSPHRKNEDWLPSTSHARMSDSGTRGKND